jgi:hypothetical protein
MKTKNLLQLKNYLLKVWIIGVLTGFVFFGTALKANAQKYELTGNKSSITQTTEITLSGSTEGKFYYLFMIDGNGNYQYLKAQVGHNVPLKFGSDFKEEGTYVVYEFNEFKGLPFDFKKHNPSEGAIQNGEIKIDKSNQN